MVILRHFRKNVSFWIEAVILVKLNHYSLIEKHHPDFKQTEQFSNVVLIEFLFSS